MSQINVNRIKDSNEGAPDFPSGVNVGGITSTVTLGVTNLNPTNLNVSGVVTATTLDGNLLATGTPTLGLGVTINASGLNISGVATAGIVSATTLYGDGSNLTGIALTIAPLNYNPAVNSQASHLTKASGIGLTFNQAVKAGSGNVTLSIANAGVAGTVVENFGVGNSVTYGVSDYGTTITITPTADLSVGQDYHLSYPSGAFTNIGGDVSYVGTAYTFQARSYDYQLWGFGTGRKGVLGLNDTADRSSPTQIPGTTWSKIFSNDNMNFDGGSSAAIKTDGTLWVWGQNSEGDLGLNNRTNYSSPVQLGSETTWTDISLNTISMQGIKTDGTMWTWGTNGFGQLAQNNTSPGYSSPVQIPGTTWSKLFSGSYKGSGAIKSDGTLWRWGINSSGQLGVSDKTARSSPIQIPGTTWKDVALHDAFNLATKTDGTLWAWGTNNKGNLGQNNTTQYSSPKQIPGTNWNTVSSCYERVSMATKTDGTLWAWGDNEVGALGLNSQTDYSSPVQIPGTTWSSLAAQGVLKTDGTLWTWGDNEEGQLGQNDVVDYSSPVQVPGTDWYEVGGMGGGRGGAYGGFALVIKRV